MFDPSIGRWLTPDPIGFAGGDENLYRFVGNNPTNATDPSGLQLRVNNQQKLDSNYNPFSLIDTGPSGYRSYSTKIYSRGFYQALEEGKRQHETALIRVSLQGKLSPDGTKINLLLVYQILESPASRVGVSPSAYGAAELNSNVPNHMLSSAGIGGSGQTLDDNSRWTLNRPAWESQINLGTVSTNAKGNYSGVVGIISNSIETKDRKQGNSAQLIRWQFKVDATPGAPQCNQPAGFGFSADVTLEETGYGRDAAGKDALKLWQEPVLGGIGEPLDPAKGSRFPLNIGRDQGFLGGYNLDSVLNPPK